MRQHFHWAKDRFLYLLQQTRYIILGVMDGTLTALGAVSAGLFASLTPWETFKLTLGAGIGITAASFTGAYLAEQAEQSKQRAAAEKAMGVKRGYLAKTLFKLNQERKVLFRALADSSAAFAGTLVTAVPLVVLPAPLSFYTSLAFAFALLFGVGAYLGRLNKTSLLKSGLRVLAVCVAVFLISLLFGRA